MKIIIDFFCKIDKNSNVIQFYKKIINFEEKQFQLLKRMNKFKMKLREENIFQKYTPLPLVLYVHRLSKFEDFIFIFLSKHCVF